MLDTETGSESRFIYRFAHCELSEATGELRVRGELVPLPPRDRALLFYLVRRAGEFVSNEDTISAVWGDYPASGKTVGNTILKVRQAIGDDDHSIIRNERNRGYILVAPIEKTQIAETPALQLVEGMAVPGRPDCLLERKIGTGGYGDVWLCKGPTGKSVFKFSRESAHQSAIKREVTISRLLEASLPQDQHGHFVPILEWDFEVWPSYVETPYAGQNLKAWAVGKGGLKSVPLADRLEIMASIADAVALAHSVGALHKDLKPENILIEEANGQRQVRLTDFGAGYLLSRDKLDQMAITVRGWTMTRATDATSGTLLWMAPELFEGAPPTLQSDVYSLGVMLYQMAVGDLGRVLAPDWLPDISDELLREDIDIATRRNPAQRLGDAKELARRLRNLDERRSERENLRSKLRRTEEAEEALKKARARRPYVWATAATLLIGLCTSSYFYYEQLQKTRAARALSDFVADDFLNAALPANGGTATITLKDAMMKAVPLAKVRFAKEPDLEAKILGVFGNTMSELGAFSETATIMTRLAELDAKLHGRNSDDVLIDRLIIAYDQLEQGQLDDANKQMAELRPLIRKNGPKGKAYPVWLQIESMFAFEQSDFESAIRTAKTTIDYYKSIQSSASFNVSQLYLAYSTLVQNLVYAGHSAEAVREGRSFLEEISSSSGMDNTYALAIRELVASALRDQSMFEEASKEFSTICPLIEKQNGNQNKDSLDCRLQEAQLFADEGKWTEAASALQAAHQSFVALTDDCGTQSSCVYTTANLALSLSKTGQITDALKFARQALHAAPGSSKIDKTVMAYALYVMGNVLIDAGRADEARPIIDQYADWIKSPATDRPEWRGRGRLLEARVLLSNKLREQALSNIDEAIGQFRQSPTLSIVEMADSNKIRSSILLP